jgi:hypothetical protein
MTAVFEAILCAANNYLTWPIKYHPWPRRA